MNERDNHFQWLAQADLLLWAADWLRPLDRDSSRVALSPAERQELLKVAGLAPWRGLADALEVLEDQRKRTPHAAWQDEYHRLFETGGMCPVDQAAYVRRDKGAILGDVCGFYRAFGFAPYAGDGDRPDHLACQMQFAALLLVMLAQARTHGHVDQEQVTRHALISFVSDHLDEWIEPFCQRLELISMLSLYRQVAVTLRLLWEAVIATHDWPRADRSAVHEVTTSPEHVGSPYECGMEQTPGQVELRIGSRPDVVN